MNLAFEERIGVFQVEEEEGLSWLQKQLMPRCGSVTGGTGLGVGVGLGSKGAG